MNKKGEIGTAIAIITLIAMSITAISGSYLVINDAPASITSHVIKDAPQDGDAYVADITASFYYYIDCVSCIPNKNRVYFKSSREAEELGLSYSPNCLE